MRLRALFVLAGVMGMTGALGTTAALGADPVDEALAELAAKYAKLKSYTANIHHYQRVVTPDGNSMQNESQGQIEVLGHEGKLLFRAEAKDAAVHRYEGKETKTEGKSVNISDGEYFYAFSDNDGQKTVIKQRPDPMLAADAKTMLTKMREEHNIKLGAEQVFDGEECYVFELMPKKQEDHPMMGKTLIQFRKADGIRAQTIGIDPTGAPLFKSIARDVKINVDIPLDRFKFEMPKDAQLMDMTEGK